MKLRDIIPLIFTGIVLTSCVKDDLHYAPHPEYEGKGMVEVTADFSRRSADSQLPDSYILRIGTQEQTVTGTTNLFDRQLDPDTYTLLVYNDPAGITISGTTATVEAYADGTLNSSLGSLFAGTQQITVTADEMLQVTQVMKQFTRTLVLHLNLSAEDARRIQDIAATLSGIAVNADIATGVIDTTTSGTVAPVFELKSGTSADGTTQWYIEASIVIIGISGQQKLTLVITLDNGQQIVIEDDISEELDGFNDDDEGGGSGGGGGTGGGGGGDEGGGKDPIEIDADIELPVDGGVEGTIGEWSVVENGNIDIH